MRLQPDELAGWVVECADFSRLPPHGFLFYEQRYCYVCYPRYLQDGAYRVRDVLPRVVDLLVRSGVDAFRLRMMQAEVELAETEDA